MFSDSRIFTAFHLSFLSHDLEVTGETIMTNKVKIYTTHLNSREQIETTRRPKVLMRLSNKSALNRHDTLIK